MTQATGEALLDLDTLIERPFIIIDGDRVDILNPAELSVIESHRLGVWGKKIDALAEEANEEAEAELAKLVDLTARKICIGASDEQFAKLTGSQRWDIIEVFTGLLLRKKLMVAGAIAAAAGEMPAWIGASSFPGSSGSTADGRRTGWRRFLPGWFARS